MPPSLSSVLRDAPDARVHVGYSGGLDSTVLLHALAAEAAVRRRGLRALHVHHGLHPDADAWVAHCQGTCDALGVPLSVVRVDVVADGRGPEASARAARHAAYAAALGPGDAMALAHHREDQAETFLLRALRASGPEGLASMAAWRPCGQGALWRPLLATPRALLLAYAHAHGLRWVEDPSNADAGLDRNFLRARVLPLLRERWPAADAALARSAALSHEAAALLGDGDAAALAAASVDDGRVLALDVLATLPRARRARVLRRWIAARGLPPLPAEGVSRIEQDLLAAAADASACFAWHGAEVRAWHGGLHAGPPVPPLPSGWAVAWDGRAPLPLPGGGALRLDPAIGFDAPVMVRAREGGERIVLAGRRHSHALKQVLQAEGIPPWVRAAMPVVVDANGEVLAAGARIRSAAFDAWLRANGAQLAWAR